MTSLNVLTHPLENFVEPLALMKNKNNHSTFDCVISMLLHEKGRARMPHDKFAGATNVHSLVIDNDNAAQGLNARSIAMK